MITNNLEEVLKSLQQLEQTIVRKFDYMFTEFFYEVGEILIKNTPYGTPDETEHGAYHRRNRQPFYGEMLPSGPGLARNNWAFSAPTVAGRITNPNVLFSSASSAFMGGLVAGDESGSLSRTRIQTQVSDYDVRYNGFVVFYNKTPYITKNRGYFPGGSDWFGNTQGLEQGLSLQAPQGITKPTVDEIQSIYKASAKFRLLFEKG